MSKVVHGIYLLAGGNLGNPPETFLAARQMLHPSVRVSRVSSLYITAPWKMESKKMFHNQVWEVETALAAHDLLDILLEVEQRLGRTRVSSEGYQDRLIDLDILLFRSEVINDSRLSVPHPHLCKRAFALLPLLELESTLRSPIDGLLYENCLAELSSDQKKINRIVGD